jgi:heterodisulfide reductase subunit A-like polyferredoxin
MNNSVLVLGASVAGMRSAAELAQQGIKVYLVEKESQIGGYVTELDHLFPDEECAACATQPLILELLNNPNVTILTAAELQSLDGKAGDFRVEVSQEQTADKDIQQKQELHVGAVIVATGMEVKEGEMPGRFKKELGALSEQLGLDLNEDGRLKRDPESGHPLLTTKKGIFMCGAAQGPNGIGESVIQACAAASHAASFLASPGRDRSQESERQKTLPIETQEEPKLAVIFDQGNGDIKDLLDLDELIMYARSLPGVLQAEVTPNAADGSKIQELLSAGDYNRLIVAGPSPIPHEGLFQQHVAKAGLNPYLLEMVNLDYQCAQVHRDEKNQATQKAKTLLRMGIARAEGLEPLEELEVDNAQTCLVIGGSSSGVACTIRLVDMGINVHLVDSSNELGKIKDNDHPLLKPLIKKLSDSDNVTLHSTASVEEINGYLGNFTAKLDNGGKSDDIKAGAIVFASRVKSPLSQKKLWLWRKTKTVFIKAHKEF